MGIAIGIFIFVIVCFFVAYNAIAENERKKKIEEERRAEERARLDKAKKLKEEISRLHSLMYEISSNFIKPISTDEEKQIFEMNQEKRREYRKRADALEVELYNLTGQPTSSMFRLGIANVMREQWNKNHNVQPPAPKAEKKPEISPELIGMSAALLTNAIAEKERKEREHQKEIKALNDEIKKLRGR